MNYFGIYLTPGQRLVSHVGFRFMEAWICQGHTHSISFPMLRTYLNSYAGGMLKTQTGSVRLDAVLHVLPAASLTLFRRRTAQLNNDVKTRSLREDCLSGVSRLT